MKKKSTILFYLFAVIGLTPMLLSGCSNDEETPKKDVSITWANPADISVGTQLSTTQLNATSNAAGTFVYTPAIGTILNAGINQSLRVDFTPTDTEIYNSTSKTVTINVTIQAGDSYQGGKVAYICVTGDQGYVAGQTHGLITTESDQASGIVWHNGSLVATSTTATAYGTGNSNTVTIMNKQGTGNYAANLCAGLVYGGYSDWYLPSQDELNKLYINRLAIGGFANATYWTSSETAAPLTTAARSQSFIDGSQFNGYKDNLQHVRAVRAF